MITTHAKNTASQSELEANTCNRSQARENEQVIIGFRFTSASNSLSRQVFLTDYRALWWKTIANVNYFSHSIRSVAILCIRIKIIMFHRQIQREQGLLADRWVCKDSCLLSHDKCWAWCMRRRWMDAGHENGWLKGVQLYTLNVIFVFKLGRLMAHFCN